MKLSDGQTEPRSFVAKWAIDTITAAMELQLSVNHLQNYTSYQLQRIEWGLH